MRWRAKEVIILRRWWVDKSRCELCEENSLEMWKLLAKSWKTKVFCCSVIPEAITWRIRSRAAAMSMSMSMPAKQQTTNSLPQSSASVIPTNSFGKTSYRQIAKALTRNRGVFHGYISRYGRRTAENLSQNSEGLQDLGFRLVIDFDWLSDN